MIISATCAFGMETALSGEIKRAGFTRVGADDGFISFSGDEKTLAESLIWLRTAERIFVTAAEFECNDFDDLYEGMRQVEWEKYLNRDDRIIVNVSQRKSTIRSPRQAQRIGKKAVTDRLGAYFGINRLPEEGSGAGITIRLRGDKAWILVDAAGQGLNKRGYSLKRGKAPLRETLAAGLVLLSKWRGREIILDPFCGSGTIPIEAALIAAGIPPNGTRDFAAETWPVAEKPVWKAAREGFRKKIPDFEIIGRDIDMNMVQAARENAGRAGVASIVRFEKMDALSLKLGPGPGLMITNPPYGERLGDDDLLMELYGSLGRSLRKSDKWDLTLLTAYEDFERAFKMKSSRNRKLYNGKIKSYLYFFYGV